MRKQILQGIIRIQKCFRGHQARGCFCELKNGVTTLQSCTASIFIIFHLEQNYLRLYAHFFFSFHEDLSSK